MAATRIALRNIISPPREYLDVSNRRCDLLEESAYSLIKVESIQSLSTANPPDVVCLLFLKFNSCRKGFRHLPIFPKCLIACLGSSACQHVVLSWRCCSRVTEGVKCELIRWVRWHCWRIELLRENGALAWRFKLKREKHSIPSI